MPLNSFVYERKQGDIVTRDGMETFSAVFGRQSKLNVLLHRAVTARRAGPTSKQRSSRVAYIRFRAREAGVDVTPESLLED